MAHIYEDKHYSVDGFEYWTWTDYESDNKKLFHGCIRNGVEITMPEAFVQHSPYSKVSIQDFTRYVTSLEVWIQSKKGLTV
jgi:hypothetical protein